MAANPKVAHCPTFNFGSPSVQNNRNANGVRMIVVPTIRQYNLRGGDTLLCNVSAVPLEDTANTAPSREI